MVRVGFIVYVSGGSFESDGKWYDPVMGESRADDRVVDDEVGLRFSFL
jgi:hypothetical protein